MKTITRRWSITLAVALGLVVSAAMATTASVFDSCVVLLRKILATLYCLCYAAGVLCVLTTTVFVWCLSYRYVVGATHQLPRR